MKKIISILVALGVVAVIGFFALSNPLGRLVKLAIESFGPDMMQAEVRVSSVKISTADGKGKLSDRACQHHRKCDRASQGAD
jgi:hypothetical protein